MSNLHILLVDDHALFRSGLRFLLADLDQDVEIVEADSCAAALTLGTDNTELILLDLHLPDSQGSFMALEQLKQRFPSSTVIVLSSEDDPAVIRGAIDMGASGFIPKSSTPEIMIAALKLVIAGGLYLPPSGYTTIQQSAVTAQSDLSSIRWQGQNNISKLSARQFDVFIGAAKGRSNKRIGNDLNIAEGTVKAHLSAAFRIMNIKNRTEAVYLAAGLDLTNSEPIN